LNPLAQVPGNRQIPHPRGAKSGAVESNFQVDTGLVAVIQAWPRLPKEIRAGILAMVRATEKHRNR
jgi:hypothetical protein